MEKVVLNLETESDNRIVLFSFEPKEFIIYATSCTSSNTGNIYIDCHSKTLILEMVWTLLNRWTTAVGLERVRFY